jgi:hypothetical protein
VPRVIVLPTQPAQAQHTATAGVAARLRPIHGTNNPLVFHKQTTLLPLHGTNNPFLTAMWHQVTRGAVCAAVVADSAFLLSVLLLCSDQDLHGLWQGGLHGTVADLSAASAADKAAAAAAQGSQQQGCQVMCGHGAHSSAHLLCLSRPLPGVGRALLSSFVFMM